MKAKNIIIILCINYVLMFVISLFIETAYLGHKATLIQNMIQTAADMALEQVQVSDDFFTSEGYGLVDSEYKIKVPTITGSEYAEANMYTALSGKTTRNDIYFDAFNKSNPANGFADWIPAASKVKGMVAQFNTGGINWYYVPKVLQMGSDILTDSPALNQVNSVSPSNYKVGGIVSGMGTNTFIDLYGWQNAAKGGRVNGVDTTYYLTPISLGLTYINKEYVQKLFINNMDLLMRSQYDDITWGEGMYGTSELTKSTAYASLVDDTTFSGADYNPINNGVFTLLRGEADTHTVSGAGTVEMFKGLKEPDIEYKVIDMYDTSSNNKDLLLMLFGRDANYLKSQAKNLPNGVKANENRFIVAKVTFYAHVVVPFESLIMKEFRGMSSSSSGVTLGDRLIGTFGADISNKNNDGTNNFLDINIHKTGSEDDYVLEYTRFFAVAP